MAHLARKAATSQVCRTLIAQSSKGTAEKIFNVKNVAIVRNAAPDPKDKFGRITERSAAVQTSSFASNLQIINRKESIRQLHHWSTKKKHIVGGNPNATFAILFAQLSQAFFSSNTTIPSYIEGEKDRMKKRLAKYGFIELEMGHDGNCMMRAISHQLFGTQDNYKEVRTKITGWLQSNEEFDIDGNGTQISHFVDTDEHPSWTAYCTKIAKDGIWGDHLALVAAAQVFAKRIWILSSVETPAEVEPVTVIEPFGIQYDQTLFLSHWHENHYNSLKAVNSNTEVSRASIEGENIQ